MQFFTQVQQEDFDLCEGVQRNLITGIYNKGERALVSLSHRIYILMRLGLVHPKEELGVLYYQQRVLGETGFAWIMLPK